MLLEEHEIQRCLNFVNAAFPRLGDWQYNNEVNDEYSDFAVWGEYVPETDDVMKRHFFVTFDTNQTTWSGHLTIGQHAYLWTGADFGDAYLVDTDPCASLEEAIKTLKQKILELFTTFLS